jgi:hypothetical protein
MCCGVHSVADWPRLNASERGGWVDISLVAFDIADEAAPVVVIRLQPTVLALERVKAARRAHGSAVEDLKCVFVLFMGKQLKGRNPTTYLYCHPSIYRAPQSPEPSLRLKVQCYRQRWLEQPVGNLLGSETAASFQHYRNGGIDGICYTIYFRLPCP